MSPYYRSLRQLIGIRRLLIPSVAAVVHDPDGRLLLQRKHDSSWSLPAGAIEPGESPYEAMKRELWEETGIRAVNISLIDCFGGQAFRYVYPNGHEAEYVVLLFRCAGETEPGVVLDKETAELRYFARHEFPGLAIPYPVETLYEQSAAQSSAP